MPEFTIGGATAVAILAVYTVAGASGQEGRQAEPIAEAIESGADTYAFHCAPCHGKEGRGDGPVALSLRSKPSDLTTLARRHRNQFPRDQALDFILGRSRRVPGHGSSEMPRWGPFFQEINPFDSPIDVRVARLLKHLESLQRK